MIKLNSDSVASSKDVTKVIAGIAAEGLPSWSIKKTTLPITYGRYKKSVSKAMQTMNQHKYKRNPHVKNIYSSKFISSAESLAKTYSSY